MSEHTPTPWLKVEGKPFIYALDENCVNRFQFLVDGAHCPPKELEANARHIVKAVNYHQRLREALHRCVDGWRKSDDVFAPMQEAHALLAELDNLEQQP